MVARGRGGAHAECLVRPSVPRSPPVRSPTKALDPRSTFSYSYSAFRNCTVRIRDAARRDPAAGEGEAPGAARPGGGPPPPARAARRLAVRPVRGVREGGLRLPDRAKARP